MKGWVPGGRKSLTWRISGSVAAWNLLHLSRLTGKEDFNDQAYRQLCSFAGAVGRAPHASTFYLCALEYFLGPP